MSTGPGVGAVAMDHLTVDEIWEAGYALEAATPGAWRRYPEDDPVPGYGEFDWLSARYPDMYHDFALSTEGLVDKLHSLVDLKGLRVLDVGAGTGRSSSGLARKAARVSAIDAYASVMAFAQEEFARQGVANIDYVQGNRDALPFPDNYFDVVVFSWAQPNHHEAWRVLKPGGLLIQMGSVAEALCGEITGVLAGTDLDPGLFDPDCPDEVGKLDAEVFSGVALMDGVDSCRFTHRCRYGDVAELAALTGRIYGPRARDYFVSRSQATFAWRLEIQMGIVRKG